MSALTFSQYQIQQSHLTNLIKNQFSIITGIPGCGKTELLKSFATLLQGTNQRVIFAFPLIDMVDEFYNSTFKNDPNVVIYHSKTKTRFNKIFKSNIIITTHETLTKLDTSFTKDFILCIDELPSMILLKDYTISLTRFLNEFSSDLEVNESKQCKLVKNKELHFNTIKESLVKKYNGALKADELLSDLTSILLNDNSISYLVTDKNQALFNTGMINPIWAHIKAAKKICLSTFIIENTWLKALLSHENVSYDTIHLDVPLKMLPTFIPLFDTIENIKANYTNKTIKGHIEKTLNALNESVLVQSYTNEKYKIYNSENIGVYVTGLNSYSSYTHTAHLIHGNYRPMQYNILKQFAKMLGVNDVDFNNIIEYENLYHHVIQFAFRTNVRKRSEQTKPTYHYVFNKEIALKIKSYIPCEVDTSKMINMNNVVRNEKIINMYLSGKYTQTQIAKKHGLSERYIRSIIHKFVCPPVKM